jgi:hypothetical protein
VKLEELNVGVAETLKIGALAVHPALLELVFE